MGHGRSLPSLTRSKWSAWFFKVAVMAVIMSARVVSGDQTGVPPTGLLCISDCATCPVICSPPPPPSEHKPPPSPSPHHSPSPSYHSHSPPPPQRSPPPPPPPPPPLYYSWGAPPPPFKYINIPSGSAPPARGQPDYSYPYYYFYSSDSFSISFPAIFLFLTFSFHVMFFCW